LNRLALYGGET